MGAERMEAWTKDKSAELYGIFNWGHPYLTINDKGEICVHVDGAKDTPGISLPSVVTDLKERGIGLPVLLRFSNILDHRIRLLNEAFRRAIAKMSYKGEYRGVFPIKVNQQEEVIDQITRFGERYHHGLEAGSKPELFAAIGYMRDPESYLICNGYKDSEFIDLALYASKLGIKTVIVLEMPEELSLVLDRAAALNIRPVLGVRIRISTRAGGHWAVSAGDRSVFGLDAHEIIQAVDTLKANSMLDCLRMVHYHIGSQVPNIRDIRRSISEACRFFTDIYKEGAPLDLIDVGGGLAVDYDGSRTNFSSSRNYSTDEYATDIVEAVMACCDRDGVPHPTILSESGRATVAYYSALIFDILDVTTFDRKDVPERDEQWHEMTRNLWDTHRGANRRNVQECYNDALYYRDEVRRAFEHGEIKLRERAVAERLFWATFSKIQGLTRNLKNRSDDFEALDEYLADIYYANFSVFQSLPDAWAIDQVFPIVPIQRLNEQPTRNGIISDITCDCDGKLDRFIDAHDDARRVLPLHPISEGENYMLGVFLVGAYQETLGDLHNLMGDTNVISIDVDADGNMHYDRELAGDTVEEVLSSVEYTPALLKERVRKLAEASVRAGRINAAERRAILEAYSLGLQGYTYYET